MLHRRRFLAGGAGLGASLGATLGAASKADAANARMLSFDNLHTGERLSTAYWANGSLIDRNCRQIDWILRDFRSGDVAVMSPHLLDLLFHLRQRLETDAPFEVISGYRSPHTNAALVRASTGVATRSLHMQGMAIDIRVPGIKLTRVRDEARKLAMGGVGFYPRSDFVHVDVGRVRTW